MALQSPGQDRVDARSKPYVCGWVATRKFGLEERIWVTTKCVTWRWVRVTFRRVLSIPNYGQEREDQFMYTPPAVRIAQCGILNPSATPKERTP